MRFTAVEDARGSEWREDNKILDGMFCETTADLMIYGNVKRYEARMDSILLVADCLAQEGRIREQTFWNYIDVHQIVSDNYRKFLEARGEKERKSFN